jgi:hypothetical protein
MARFAHTVDFPTPPLQDVKRMIFVARHGETALAFPFPFGLISIPKGILSKLKFLQFILPFFTPFVNRIFVIYDR